VPLTKLKGRLHDQVGLNWQTEFGKIHLCSELADWIALNAHVSMYNGDRSYVYNKALWEAFTKINSLESLVDQIDTRTWTFDNIRAWAEERGIYEKGNSHTQFVKLQEEAGELAKALLNKDRYEIKDAIGDMVVVLTNLANLEKLNIEDCIDSAYAEIANRTGKMINGTFVKDEKKKDI
jgi:NTP pyrophosphatase (non-canonical NTP hydrolase)